MEQTNWLELLTSVLLASFGGLIKQVVEKETNPEKRLNLTSCIMSAGIGLFVGVILYLIGESSEVPVYLTFAATAIGGFAGSPLLRLLERALTKRIESKIFESKGVSKDA